MSLRFIASDKNFLAFLSNLDNNPSSSSPGLLIEVKQGQPDIQSSLYRFKTELNIPALLLTNLSEINTKKKDGISVMNLERFLSILP